MKPKLVIYKKLPQKVIESAKEKCEVSYFPEITEENRGEFEQALQEADGLLGHTMLIDQHLLEKAPKLKVVSNCTAGFDNVDVNTCTDRGIFVTNSPDNATEPTADLVFGMLLAAARRIAELDAYVKKGKWDQEIKRSQFGVDVYQKTIGIIGMGRIGGAIAKRAHFGFDMRVLYHNRRRKPEAEERYGATYVSLEELLAQSDFVVLMVPLSAETKNLIQKEHFAQMKKSAIFINASRGKTVVEQDLVEALQEGMIRGAALDVFVNEPVEKDHPLLKMDNVVTLPHIGTATEEARIAMTEDAWENCLAVLEGRVPKNLVNPEILERKK